MSLRYRLRAPVTCALVGVLVTGLFATLETAAPSFADPTSTPSPAAPSTPPSAPPGTPSSPSSTPPSAPPSTASSTAPPAPRAGRAAAVTTAEEADPGSDSKAEELAKADGLTQSRAIFPRSSYLCYGYNDCGTKGYSPAGYAAANDTMYWRMYAGHNCTNYAAYRMVKSGLPNVRPWSGGGNATYWGGKMPKITNGTPTVGAVAWWKANTGPAGSAGHVAYVERVVSSTEIIVSQDSWGGDFSWAVITKASGNWPSGFVHFNDVTLTNAAVPTVSGYAKVGGVLTASAGTWKPTTTKVSYQWFADGAAIAGAVAPTLTLAQAQLGKVITVRATGSLPGYASKAAVSRPTSAVLPGAFGARSSPKLVGTTRVDNRLVLDRGVWNVAPTAYRFQWYANDAAIPGATTSAFSLTPELAGKRVRAVVTLYRPGFATRSVSTAATPVVAPGLVVRRRGASLSGGTQPSQVLVADPGAYHPSDATVSVQWFADGAPIPGATATRYSVRPADVGHRIAMRVSVSRPGYQTTTFLTGSTARVRTPSTIRVRRHHLKHGALVRVILTAPYVRPVEGTVVVRAPGGFRRTVKLQRGSATVRVTGVADGLRDLRITYSGSERALPARAVVPVRIR